ncbi:hypothetical protein HGP14_28575 [Rhizobium sp. P32RR-XVIII]|nr:hypothetical protein [Rhizobium sp. P32RR-XVIII]
MHLLSARFGALLAFQQDRPDLFRCLVRPHLGVMIGKLALDLRIAGESVLLELGIERLRVGISIGLLA